MEDQQQNFLFPIFLKLEQLQLLIVGGGNIGLEKITAVLNNSPSTSVTLVAPVIVNEIIELTKNYPNVNIQNRAFINSDLDNKDLVIISTGDKELSAVIKKQASQRKILTNVADTPNLCDFYLGSIVKKGDLKIAISTNGKSPTLAKRIREYFEEEIPNDIQELINNLNIFRNRLKGDFSYKVKALNELTSAFMENSSQRR